MSRRSARSARAPALTARSFAAGAALTLLLVYGTQSAAYAVSSCPNSGSQNWWGRAQAATGAGTSDGSYITESMPQAGTYHIGSQGGTNEASWVVNWTWLANNAGGDYSSNGGFEIGWFMGVWPYASSYTYYYNPHPYNTTFDGHVGDLMSTSDLPENGDTVRYLSGYDDTRCPSLDIYNLTTSNDITNHDVCYSGNSIIVPTPRDTRPGRSRVECARQRRGRMDGRQ